MCNAHVLKEVKTVKQLYHKHENEAVAIFFGESHDEKRKSEAGCDKWKDLWKES